MCANVVQYNMGCDIVGAAADDFAELILRSTVESFMPFFFVIYCTIAYHISRSYTQLDAHTQPNFNFLSPSFRLTTFATH